MNTADLKTNIKRFFSNPNTLTFILVIVLIIVIYIIYSYMVTAAIKPTTLPYSKGQILEKTQITINHINKVDVSGTFISNVGDTLITNSSQIVNKYVKKGYRISPHSFFYSDALTPENINEETYLTNLPYNHTIYKLETNFHASYGCSIMNGNYIDLYLQFTTDEGLVYQRFIKSIKVLAVVNSNGEDVFTNTADDKNPNPAHIYFAVPREYNELLNKAVMLGSTIIPVPRNSKYSENPEETSIDNTAIETYILNNSVYLEDI